MVRDQKVEGSTPSAPTIFHEHVMKQTARKARRTRRNRLRTRKLPEAEKTAPKKRKADVKAPAKADVKAHREENLDRAREHQRKWVLKNKDKIREYRKAYRAKNREKILEHQKAYHAKHRERFLEYQKAYHAKHREKFLEYQRVYREKLKQNRQKLKKDASMPALPWIELLFQRAACFKAFTFPSRTRRPAR